MENMEQTATLEGMENMEETATLEGMERVEETMDGPPSLNFLHALHALQGGVVC